MNREFASSGGGRTSKEHAKSVVPNLEDAYVRYLKNVHYAGAPLESVKRNIISLVIVYDKYELRHAPRAGNLDPAKVLPEKKPQLEKPSGKPVMLSNTGPYGSITRCIFGSTCFPILPGALSRQRRCCRFWER